MDSESIWPGSHFKASHNHSRGLRNLNKKSKKSNSGDKAISSSGENIKSSKETVIDRFTEMKDELKDKVIDAVPFASESSFIKLEKKVGTLSRKMNQLKKQLKELDV